MKRHTTTILIRRALLTATTCALALATSCSTTSCSTASVQAEAGELLVSVRGGEEWLHRYSFIQKNPPQLAIWAETEGGAFAGTIFVTRKVATGGWAFNSGNPRKEALPVWSHRKVAEDLDAVTGATPKASFSVAIAPKSGSAVRRFYLYAEVNHSTDFNAAYPEDAAAGTAGYSGGSGGSGQPSLVYRVLIDLDSPAVQYELSLIGHGSPDGSDGLVTADVSALTSALAIVQTITAEVAQ